MKILILGVNGAISGCLAKFLKENNFEVYGTSSKSIKNVYCLKTYMLSLGENLPKFEYSFDFVIHSTYNKDASVEENISSTILWAKQLKNIGVKNQLFISSISAISSNNSPYAIIKKETEKYFLENNMFIIRPGLVIGKGNGLFSSMVKKVKQSPIIPLVNNGSQKIKYIGLDDLIQEIFNILVGRQKNRVLNLFYKNELTLKFLLLQISKSINKRVLFINIPYSFIFYTVRFFEIIHVNIGINCSNIKGLVENQIDLKSDINYVKEVNALIEKV